MFEYQDLIKNRRKTFQNELKGKIFTRAESKVRRKAISQTESKLKWERYLHKVKSAYADPTSSIHSNSHPCRPKFDHSKTPAQRKENVYNLKTALRPHKVMRRKYVVALDEIAKDFVTRDNLDAKIQYALEHPTFYNQSPQNIIDEEKRLKDRLRETRVPSSDRSKTFSTYTKADAVAAEDTSAPAIK